MPFVQPDVERISVRSQGDHTQIYDGLCRSTNIFIVRAGQWHHRIVVSQITRILCAGPLSRRGNTVAAAQKSAASYAPTTPFAREAHWSQACLPTSAANGGLERGPQRPVGSQPLRALQSPSEPHGTRRRTRRLPSRTGPTSRTGRAGKNSPFGFPAEIWRNHRWCNTVGPTSQIHSAPTCFRHRRHGRPTEQVIAQQKIIFIYLANNSIISINCFDINSALPRNNMSCLL